APKTQCNALKLAQVVTWMQKSRSVFSLKDLEKELPKIAGISGMQVKDYIQALQDDNKISCEKIGAGNWFFSFPSQAKREADSSLKKVRGDHEQINGIVKDLHHKLAERAAQLEQEETMTDAGVDSREELMHEKAVLEADLQTLRKQLAAYSEDDPAEMQRRETECTKLYHDADQYTDHIVSMEEWLEKACGTEAVSSSRFEYGEEWDTEEFEMTPLSDPNGP
ncbi:Meiotic nuclear division protein 1-like, partial [Pseudocercospora fuligena]